MCKAFSCLVGVDKKVTWKFGVDSHLELVLIAGYKDQTSDPTQMTFARVEITPDNKSYLNPDNWSLRVDESITPAWFSQKHRELAFAAHKKWETKLKRILVHKKIVYPFEITPPVISKAHIRLLKQCSLVQDSVRNSGRDSVWDSVQDSVWDSVQDSVWDSVRNSVWDSVRNSVWDSVRNSVWDSVRNSVWASVRNSVWDSVRNSVGAYIGSFFNLPKWQRIKHPKGKYPFRPFVRLWEAGLVPSFDGATWRLHGGKKAAVLFSIADSELRK